MKTVPFFGWSMMDPGRAVEACALLGDHGRKGLTERLITFLKDKQEVYVGPKQNLFGSILFHYFLSQSYFSELYKFLLLSCGYTKHAKLNVAKNIAFRAANVIKPVVSNNAIAPAPEVTPASCVGQ